MRKTTSITVDKDFLVKLKTYKKYRRETYQDTIDRIIKNSLK